MSSQTGEIPGVLIIDDQPDSVRLAFDRARIPVIVAENTAALRALSSETYSSLGLICLDGTFPHHEGGPDDSEAFSSVIEDFSGLGNLPPDVVDIIRTRRILIAPISGDRDVRQEIIETAEGFGLATLALPEDDDRSSKVDVSKRIVSFLQSINVS